MLSLCTLSHRNTASTLQRGLTLVELVVTMAVLAVLIGIALPSFTPLMQRWQADRAAAELESALLLARSEGIQRGGGLSLIRTPSSDTCTATDNEWQCGWTLAIDKNQDGIADSFGNNEPSTVLRQSSSSFPNVSITASAQGTAILVDRWGSLSLIDSGNRFSLTARPSAQAQADTARLCIKPGGHLQKIKASNDCSN